jgi:outer membrane receptor protein involved in Fe transport
MKMKKNYALFKILKGKSCGVIILLPLLFFFFSIFSSETILAKEKLGKIKGRVSEKFTKKPLSGAEVKIKGLSLHAITDENGNFTIENIPFGEYSVEVSLPGFKTQVKTRIIVIPESTISIDFELEEAPLESHSVTVYPEYFIKNKDEITSTSRLTYYEVRGDPEGYNLPRMLSSLPGVATAEDYSASIIVRGGNPDENLVLIDNVEIDSPVHFPDLGGGGGGMTIINTELVKDVSFSSGGFPARFGGKLSSIMNISMREGNREKFESTLDLSMAGLSIIAEGPLSKKTSFILNYRNSFYKFLDKFSEIGDVIPEYEDYYARFDIDLNPNNKAWLFWIRGKDYMEVPEEIIFSSEKLIWRGNQDIIGFNWRSLFKNSGYLLTTFAFINNWADLSAGKDFQLKNKQTHIFGKFSFTKEIFKNHIFEIGAQFGNLELSRRYMIKSHRSPSGFIVEEEDLEGEFNSKKSFFYIQDLWEIRPWANLKLGFRYEIFDMREKGILEPRVCISFSITPRLNLNLGFGKFSQSPPLNILPIQKNLKPERATHSIIGLDYLLREDIKLSFEAYYKDFDSLVISESDLKTDYSNNGSGYSRGIELFLHKKLSHSTYGRLSYSYGISKRKDPINGDYPSDWDQRHILTLIGGWKITKKMELSFKWRFSSGRPYTPYLSERRFQIPGDTAWYCPKDERKNSNYYPPYHRLDLQFSRKDHFKGITIIGYINIQNVYNRKNIYTEYWDMDEGKIKYSYQFFFMPVGGFMIRF